ncbi:6-carboxytetrahydropterin synthase [Halobacterium salinarum]|nr:6-carboxytetrahydropterin synthase [Halobacterium salinarum]
MTPTTHTDATRALTVRREFIAQHYLTVPNPGPEGEVHSHRFTADVTFAGGELDEHGYLVDIDAVDAVLDDIEARYQDTLLNDHAEFGDANPSLERLAELIGDRIADGLGAAAPTRLTVRLWEDDLAWASHERALE